MLHLGNEIAKMFAVLTLATPFRNDDILGCRECRFLENDVDLLAPRSCDADKVRSVERLCDMRIDSIRCEELPREPPRLIKRLLHSRMAFLTAIT